MATLYWDGTVAFCIITLSTHWGRVTHICISKLNMAGSDNGLLPGQQQAIIWTNTGILSIWVLGTKFSEMLVKIQMFSFKKMHLKMLSVKLGLNVLRRPFQQMGLSFPSIQAVASCAESPYVWSHDMPPLATQGYGILMPQDTTYADVLDKVYMGHVLMA